MAVADMKKPSAEFSTGLLESFRFYLQALTRSASDRNKDCSIAAPANTRTNSLLPIRGLEVGTSIAGVAGTS